MGVNVDEEVAGRQNGGVAEAMIDWDWTGLDWDCSMGLASLSPVNDQHVLLEVKKKQIIMLHQS